MRFRCHALPRQAIATPINSVLFRCSAKLSFAFARRCPASPHLAIAMLLIPRNAPRSQAFAAPCSASRRFAIAPPCPAWLRHCSARPRPAWPLRCSALPRFAMPFLCTATQNKAIAVPRWAARRLAIPQLSSSQVKRPFPELRHWPRPRRAP